MFFEQFKKMCEKKGQKPASVLAEIGIKKSNATNWKNGSMPSLGVLIQLADYFECSLDYLMGRDNVGYSFGEQIDCSLLNELGISKVQEYIQDLIENPKYIKGNSISKSMEHTIKTAENFPITIKQK